LNFRPVFGVKGLQCMDGRISLSSELIEYHHGAQTLPSNGYSGVDRHEWIANREGILG
jgi:hypothetical protein